MALQYEFAGFWQVPDLVGPEVIENKLQRGTMAETKLPGKKLTDEQIALVEQHLGFAKRLAQGFCRKHQTFNWDEEDMQGAAYLGLCDAARRYDASKGIAFAAFSSFRIRGAMFDLMRHGGGVSRRQFIQLKACAADNQEADDECSGDESDHVETKESGDKSSLPFSFAKTQRDLASLAAIVEQAGIHLVVNRKKVVADITYLDDQNPELKLTNKSTAQFLAKLVSQLDPDSRKVIELRYFKDKSHEEISKALKVTTRNWVSRVHIQALEKLRNKIIIAQKEIARREQSLGLR